MSRSHKSLDRRYEKAKAVERWHLRINGSRLACTNGKATFSKRGLAKKAAKHARSIYGKEFGTYRCKVCRFWHLYTKKPRIQRCTLLPAPSFEAKPTGSESGSSTIFSSDSIAS